MAAHNVNTSNTTTHNFKHEFMELHFHTCADDPEDTNWTSEAKVQMLESLCKWRTGLQLLKSACDHWGQHTQAQNSDMTLVHLMVNVFH